MRGEGDIRILEGGAMIAGIPTTYNTHSSRIEVQQGGTFRIPRYSRVQMDVASENFVVQPEGTLVVEGKLFVDGEVPSSKKGSFKWCGDVRGSGTIVGDAEGGKAAC